MDDFRLDASQCLHDERRRVVVPRYGNKLVNLATSTSHQSRQPFVSLRLVADDLG